MLQNIADVAYAIHTLFFMDDVGIAGAAWATKAASLVFVSGTTDQVVKLYKSKVAISIVCIANVLKGIEWA